MVGRSAARGGLAQATRHPFLVLRLGPGWRLARDGRTLIRGRTRRLRPELPRGCALLQALPLPGRPRGPLAPVEVELARIVVLVLADHDSPADWLETARGWEFVEDARLP